MCLIGVYMNLQLTFLLKNEDYFGKMDSDNITKISSLLTVVSLPCSMIATFFVSHACADFFTRHAGSPNGDGHIGRQNHPGGEHPGQPELCGCNGWKGGR